MAKILVVDDSIMDQRVVGKLLTERDGEEWHVEYAANGADALQHAERARPDLVLTDMQMPEMNGLELVDEIKAKFANIPVILMTAHGSEDLAIQALRRGAASYVPKRMLAADLIETIENVLTVASTQKEKERFLDECWLRHKSQFMLPNDLSLIAPLIGNVQDSLAKLRICDENGLIRVAVALREAICNAVLHGNLEIDSELKETDDQAFHREMERRKQLEPYCDRHVLIAVDVSRSEASFVVTDGGKGFDHANLPDPTAEENLERLSGRGLLLIRTFMDHFEFNDQGNELTMVKRRVNV